MPDIKRLHDVRYKAALQKSVAETADRLCFKHHPQMPQLVPCHRHPTGDHVVVGSYDRRVAIWLQEFVRRLVFDLSFKP